jgi:hypothetical protein
MSRCAELAIWLNVQVCQLHLEVTMLEEGEEEREEEEEVAPLLKSRDLSPGRWGKNLRTVVLS